MKGDTRAEAAAVLAQHQGVSEVTGYADPVALPLAACMCGAGDHDVTVGAERWIAEHQVAVLVAAGIEPFAVDRVVAP